MANLYKRPPVILTVERLETREMPSASSLTLLSARSFDTMAAGTSPAGWAQWQSQGPFAVWSQAGYDRTPGLTVTANSSGTDRAWYDTAQGANIQVSADVLASSLIPVQILARGSNLDSAAPTYYALSVTRGLGASLVRTVNGVSTTLAHLQSAQYVSDVWVQLSLIVSGTTLEGFVQRLDTGTFLNAHGQWQASATPALTIRDRAIGNGDLTGFARPAGVAGTVDMDNFRVLGLSGNARTAAPTYVQQGFNSSANGQLPAAWSQWTSAPAAAVGKGRALSGSNGLDITTAAGEGARAWLNTTAPADAQVSAAAYLNGLIPAEVFLRGSNLDGSTPSYYAVAVTRGVQVQLLRVVNGASTVLSSLVSKGYVSNQWVQVSLQAAGSTLQAYVERLDTNQYLGPDGQWQALRAAVLTVSDGHVTGAGLAGVSRGGGLAGTIVFDNFSVSSASSSLKSGTPSARPAVTKGTTPKQGSASRAAPEAAHGPSVKPAVETLYTPQHYSWVRLAELAYSGTPLGAFGAQLLKHSVDLVIPNAAYLGAIHSIAPNTPQLTYTNVSSIYGDLLLAWDNWAEAHGVDPESAFYHVTTPTVFSGDSSGSQPVDWFWGVYESGARAKFTDLTSAARAANGQHVPFGQYGTSLYLAYPDPYALINFHLASGARNGWQGVLQYATGVDAKGNPTGWANLMINTDTTDGLTRSGQITFDPPAGWTPVSVNGSARMYYLRILTVHGGTAPVASTILGDDYVHANGGSSGIIPAFDYAADKNHDGYLDNAEYAVALAHGDTARFAYQSRLFQPYDGQERFAINPASPPFEAFAVQYYTQLLNSEPLADGLFIDNSTGKAPATAGTVLESVSNYSQAYGALLNAIGQAIAPRWLIANTSGGNNSANSTVQLNTAYFVESAIRPLADNWEQFENMAEQLAVWDAQRSPTPYAVLDSLPTGGSVTDPRTQIATLAEYYLVANPQTTFLDFYGGYSPASSWTLHWSQAVAYNVGQPEGAWSVFATGSDPSNRALTYKVYQRQYTNALVLYRPLSHTQGNGAAGTTGDASAVTFRLGGTYRPLLANGTLGARLTSISLRNGEGAILVKG